MSSIQPLPLAELNTRALRVLIQEMGVVNTARFIHQYTHGFGDYTQEREQLFTDLTIDDIVAAVERDPKSGRDF
ncbi:hypothetical protein EYB53_005990 [Candidatus Chloroploca sp. M-50]|uniref:Uncharacterized protein n=1 Tax=Candidatus Chloroploca mongolica TaxID=2528176 RepID=A0ABS4D743_9CHLR|nr:MULTISPECIES: hypothetical protein [Candidatus Chloroploca]MBP1465252.1 hypothetical protein [Candidatus Chloroploca mongolica]